MEVSESDEEPTGFNFCGLPVLAQRAVVEKLDLMTYLSLRRCSTVSKRLCDSSQHQCDVNVSKIFFTPFDLGYNPANCSFTRVDSSKKIPWNAITTSCRLISEKLILNQMLDPFDDGTCTKLLDFLMTRRVSVKEVYTLLDLDCSIDNLHRMFRTIGVTGFISERCILQKEGIIGHPFLRELECVASSHCVHQPLCSLPTPFFLSLRSPILKMPITRTDVTAINQYLKQWQRKERDIQLLWVNPVWSGPLDNTAVYALLDGLAWANEPGPVQTTNEKVQELLETRSFKNVFLLCRPDAVLYLKIARSRGSSDFLCCFSAW